MWRKYKNLCLLGSGLATFLTLGTVQATGYGLENVSAKTSEPIVNQAQSNSVLQSLHGVLLADASTATRKLSKQGTSGASSEKIKLESYNLLDNETEQLLKEVLNLSSDLAILEEEQNTPAKHQLLVLVTMKPSKLFKLDYVELKIDNHTVAAYNYTSSDVQALKQGGGHRLYLALLPAGMHKLSATMAGRIPRDPDYNKAVNYSFVSGKGRTVVELIVSSEQSNSFPILAVKEWNQ